MKFKTIYLMITLFAMLMMACSFGTPTAVVPTRPVAVPTEAPPNRGDPVWDRVKSTGKLVVGTSADYQPFEYYDANYEIIGFDAALARELGARLGVQVELVDIAFEGLPAALMVGQVDAAMAAISVTPERQAMMDFSNVYYSGQDAILARQNANIPPIVAAAQMAPYRVAAQRGSIYATWVQRTLIDSGLMPQTNLLLYAKAGDAVRDLRENRNDLVVLDKLAADEFILGGGVVSVGGNLNRQLFAIALPKGAPTLQAELNAALIALQNDGTIARLTEDYLDIKVSVGVPVPLPTAIPVPGPTPTPAGCFDGLTFVSDVKIPDGTKIQASQEFQKVWRVRNTGTCTWNKNYQLVYVQGNRMSGSSTFVTERVNPGNAYEIEVNMKAPKSSGKYTGFWQMVNANGVPFGERIYVKITVPRAEPEAPSAGPVIHYLDVSSESVNQGDLLIVSWSFSGEGLASARLTRTNPDGSKTELYSGADVAPHGEYEDLMMTPGKYTYTLSVSAEFGGTTTHKVTVNVNSN